MINASFLLCLLLAGATTELSGRVVDQDDQPVKDAIVVISTAKPRVGPATTCPSCYRDCAKRTLTDDQGRFQISVGKHIRAIDFRFSAAGFATADVHWLRADKRDVRVELGSGASLRGRLLLDGDPLASVEVRLVQENRIMGNLVTPVEVSTDAKGLFQFDQLPPDLDYAIYTHTGQDARGVLPVSLIQAPGHGQRAELGGHRCAGAPSIDHQGRHQQRQATA